MILDEEVLEHYGVKGMRWGVRKKRGVHGRADKLERIAERRPTRGNVRKAQRARRESDRRYAKQDAKWQKNIYSVKGAIAVHNKAADIMNGGVLDRFNAKAKYKNLDAFDDNHPLTKEYFKEYEELSARVTARAVREVHGTSPSGGYQAKLVRQGDNMWVDVRPKNVEHQDLTEVEFKYELVLDSKGMIVQMKQIDNSLMQTAIEEYVDDILEHYGVKGMKWGKRKGRPDSDVRQERATSSKNRRILTDDELKQKIERLSNEKKLKTLTDEDLSPGKTIAKRVLSESGQKVARTVVTGAALYGVKVAVDRQFNPRDAANYIAPRPKNK